MPRQSGNATGNPRIEYFVNGVRVDKPPRPAWMDKDPSEWTASARTVYTILAMAAERELAEERNRSQVGRRGNS